MAPEILQDGSPALVGTMECLLSVFSFGESTLACKFAAYAVMALLSLEAALILLQVSFQR